MTDKQAAKPDVFQFHSADNPQGFFAQGTTQQAAAYMRRLNFGRVINLWTARKVNGRRRGIDLTELLAQHRATTAATQRATTNLLNHQPGIARGH